MSKALSSSLLEPSSFSLSRRSCTCSARCLLLSTALLSSLRFSHITATLAASRNSRNTAVGEQTPRSALLLLLDCLGGFFSCIIQQQTVTVTVSVPWSSTYVVFVFHFTSRSDHTSFAVSATILSLCTLLLPHELQAASIEKKGFSCTSSSLAQSPLFLLWSFSSTWSSCSTELISFLILCRLN